MASSKKPASRKPQAVNLPSQDWESIFATDQALHDLLEALGGAVAEATQDGLRELLVGEVARAQSFSPQPRDC